jgi:DNA-binding CsgD family transcriptional regulator
MVWRRRRLPSRAGADGLRNSGCRYWPGDRPPAAWKSADLSRVRVSVMEPSDELLRQLRRSPLSEPSPKSLVRKEPLSNHELEVAKPVAAGMSNPAIARRLTVSRPTVATHVQHILTKLNFSSRAQIAVWAVARRHSLTSRPEWAAQESTGHGETSASAPAKQTTRETKGRGGVTHASQAVAC